MRRALIACCAILAACATPAERAQYMQREMDRMMVEFGPACERLGYARESDPWRDCVLRLSSQMELRYNRNYPIMTQCFGQPGSFMCNTF